MERIKPNLSINLDFNLVKVGELSHFFRPFIWKNMKYSFIWEEENLKPSEENSSLFFTDTTPSQKETSAVVQQDDLTEKVDGSESRINVEKPINDIILASYKNIAKRYKS